MTLYNRVLTPVSNGSVDFGFRDQKGRAVGYRWVINAVKMVAKPEDAMSGYRLEDGMPLEHFEVTTSPTRNGEGYGPAFNRAWAATMETIEIIIAHRTEQARKRDTKKFVK